MSTFIRDTQYYFILDGKKFYITRLLTKRFEYICSTANNNGDSTTIWPGLAFRYKNNELGIMIPSNKMNPFKVSNAMLFKVAANILTAAGYTPQCEKVYNRDGQEVPGYNLHNTFQNNTFPNNTLSICDCGPNNYSSTSVIIKDPVDSSICAQLCGDSVVVYGNKTTTHDYSNPDTIPALVEALKGVSS